MKGIGVLFSHPQLRVAHQVAHALQRAPGALEQRGERRAKLLGTDAPAKVTPTTPDGEGPWSLDGLSSEEVAEGRAEVERLMVQAVGGEGRRFVLPRRL